MPDEMEYESKVAGLEPGAVESERPPGQLSTLTCPECGGSLYELHDGQLLRFRCRVAHAYTADSGLEEKTEALEGALYTALNTLQESVAMAERLAAKRAGTSTFTRRRASRSGRKARNNGRR